MNALKVTLSAYGRARRVHLGEGFLKMLSVPLLLTVLYSRHGRRLLRPAAMVVEFSKSVGIGWRLRRLGQVSGC